MTNALFKQNNVMYLRGWVDEIDDEGSNAEQEHQHHLFHRHTTKFFYHLVAHRPTILLFN